MEAMPARPPPEEERSAGPPGRGAPPAAARSPSPAPALSPPRPARCRASGARAAAGSASSPRPPPCWMVRVGVKPSQRRRRTGAGSPPALLPFPSGQSGTAGVRGKAAGRPPGPLPFPSASPLGASWAREGPPGGRGGPGGVGSGAGPGEAAACPAGPGLPFVIRAGRWVATVLPSWREEVPAAQPVPPGGAPRWAGERRLRERPGPARLCEGRGFFFFFYFNNSSAAPSLPPLFFSFSFLFFFLLFIFYFLIFNPLPAVRWMLCFEQLAPRVNRCISERYFGSDHYGLPTMSLPCSKAVRRSANSYVSSAPFGRGACSAFRPPYHTSRKLNNR